jgi:hypothetical protein
MAPITVMARLCFGDICVYNNLQAYTQDATMQSARTNLARESVIPRRLTAFWKYVRHNELSELGSADVA